MTRALPTPTDALKVIIATDDSALGARVVDRLRRDTHRFRLRIAPSGTRAMKALQSAEFDVLVASSHLPDLEAAQLLGWTKRNRPQVARIVFADSADGLATVRRMPAAQHHLDAGGDPAAVRGTLERTHALNRLLLDPAARRAVRAHEGWPPMPKCYADLTVAGAADGAAAPDPRTFTLAHGDRPTGTLVAALPARAHGIETLRAAVIAAHLFDKMIPGAPPECRPEILRERAVRRVGAVLDGPHDAPECDAACAAALLADVGLVALLHADPVSWLRAAAHAREKGLPLDEAERLVLGIDHGEAAAVTLGGWGLPFVVLEAIAYHHRPGLVTEGDRSVLAAVHRADHAVGGDAAAELDQAFLRDVEGAAVAETAGG